MSLGWIIGIVLGIIIVGAAGVMLGIYIFVNYMTSPNGFVKDLTGNSPPPSKPVDPIIMRMHLDALQAEDKDAK